MATPSALACLRIFSIEVMFGLNLTRVTSRWPMNPASVWMTPWMAPILRSPVQKQYWQRASLWVATACLDWFCAVVVSWLVFVWGLANDERVVRWDRMIVSVSIVFMFV